MAAGAFRRGLQRHVARQYHYRYAAVKYRFTHRDGQHLWDLLGGGDQFTVVAAFTEQLLRMRLLKVAATDFTRRNMRRNGEDGHVITVTIKKTVDEVQISRPTRPGADREFAGQLCFGACREGGNLFVSRRHPRNGAHAVKAVAQAVERIARDAPDSLHASLFERFGNVVGYGLFHWFSIS